MTDPAKAASGRSAAQAPRARRVKATASPSSSSKPQPPTVLPRLNSSSNNNSNNNNNHSASSEQLTSPHVRAIPLTLPIPPRPPPAVVVKPSSSTSVSNGAASSVTSTAKSAWTTPRSPTASDVASLVSPTTSQLTSFFASIRSSSSPTSLSPNAQESTNELEDNVETESATTPQRGFLETPARLKSVEAALLATDEQYRIDMEQLIADHDKFLAVAATAAQHVDSLQSELLPAVSNSAASTRTALQSLARDITTLHQDHATSQRQLADHFDAVFSQQTDERVALVDAHLAERDAMQHQHALEIAELKQDSTRRIAAIQTETSERIAVLEHDTAEQIAVLQAAHNAREGELQLRLTEQTVSSSEEIRVTRAVAALELEDLRSHAVAERNERETWAAHQIAELQRRSSDELETLRATTSAAYAELKASSRAEYDTLKAATTAELEQLREASQKELNEVSTRLQAELQATRECAQRDLEALETSTSAERDRLTTQWHEDIARLQQEHSDELHAVRAAHDAEQTALETSLAETTRAYEAKIDELTARFTSEQHAIKTQAEEERKAQMEQHASDMERLKTTAATAMAEAIAQHQATLASLQQQHAAELEQERQDHVSASSAMRVAHATELQELRDVHRRERDALTLEYETQLETVRRETRESMEQQTAQHDARVAQMRDAHAARVLALETTIRELERQHSDAFSALQTKYDSECCKTAELLEALATRTVERDSALKRHRESEECLGLALEEWRTRRLRWQELEQDAAARYAAIREELRQSNDDRQIKAQTILELTFVVQSRDDEVTSLRRALLETTQHVNTKSEMLALTAESLSTATKELEATRQALRVESGRLSRVEEEKHHRDTLLEDHSLKMETLRAHLDAQRTEVKRLTMELQLQHEHMAREVELKQGELRRLYAAQHELKTRHDAQQQTIIRLEDSLAMAQRDGDEARRRVELLKLEAAQRSAEISAVREELLGQEKSNLELTNSLRAAQRDAQRMQIALNDLGVVVQRQRESAILQSMHLEDIHGRYQRELERTAKEREARRRQEIHLLALELNATRETLRQCESRLSSRERERDSLQQESERLLDALKTEQQEHSAVREALTAMTTARDELSDSLVKRNEELSMTQTELTMSIARIHELEQSLEHTTQELSTTAHSLRVLQAEREELAAALVARTTEMEHRRAEWDAEREANERHLQEREAKLQSELEQQESQFRAELERLRQTHDDTLVTLQSEMLSQHTTESEKHEERLRQLLSNLKAVECERESLRVQLHHVIATAQAERAILDATFQATIKSRETLMENRWQRELQERQQQYDNDVEALRDEWMRKAEEESKELTQRWSKQVDELVAEIQKASEDHAEALAEAREAASRGTSQWEEKLQSIERARDDAVSKLQQELQETIARLKSEREDAVAALTSERDATLEAIKAAHEAQIAALEQQINALTHSIELIKQNSLDDTVTALDEQRVSHCAELTLLREERERIELAREDSAAALLQSVSRALSTQEKRHQSLVTALEQQLKHAETCQREASEALIMDREDRIQRVMATHLQRVSELRETWQQDVVLLRGERDRVTEELQQTASQLKVSSETVLRLETKVHDLEQCCRTLEDTIRVRDATIENVRKEMTLLRDLHDAERHELDAERQRLLVLDDARLTLWTHHVETFAQERCGVLSLRDDAVGGEQLTQDVSFRSEADVLRVLCDAVRMRCLARHSPSDSALTSPRAFTVDDVVANVYALETLRRHVQQPTDDRLSADLVVQRLIAAVNALDLLRNCVSDVSGGAMRPSEATKTSEDVFIARLRVLHPLVQSLPVADEGINTNDLERLEQRVALGVSALRDHYRTRDLLALESDSDGSTGCERQEGDNDEKESTGALFQQVTTLLQERRQLLKTARDMTQNDAIQSIADLNVAVLGDLGQLRDTYKAINRQQQDVVRSRDTSLSSMSLLHSASVRQLQSSPSSSPSSGKTSEPLSLSAVATLLAEQHALLVACQHALDDEESEGSADGSATWTPVEIVEGIHALLRVVRRFESLQSSSASSSQRGFVGLEARVTTILVFLDELRLISQFAQSVLEQEVASSTVPSHASSLASLLALSRSPTPEPNADTEPPASDISDAAAQFSAHETALPDSENEMASLVLNDDALLQRDDGVEVEGCGALSDSLLDISLVMSDHQRVLNEAAHWVHKVSKLSPRRQTRPPSAHDDHAAGTAAADQELHHDGDVAKQHKTTVHDVSSEIGRIVREYCGLLSLARRLFYLRDPSRDLVALLQCLAIVTRSTEQLAIQRKHNSSSCSSTSAMTCLENGLMKESDSIDSLPSSSSSTAPSLNASLSAFASLEEIARHLHEYDALLRQLRELVPLQDAREDVIGDTLVASLRERLSTLHDLEESLASVGVAAPDLPSLVGSVDQLAAVVNLVQREASTPPDEDAEPEEMVAQRDLGRLEALEVARHDVKTLAVVLRFLQRTLPFMSTVGADDVDALLASVSDTLAQSLMVIQARDALQDELEALGQLLIQVDSTAVVLESREERLAILKAIA
ncbi:hypothetical protein PINS_up006988 [Pythium insidiosum]|nr:hypothetical protein PINS_up006988 [Pythium insidiosum]